MLKCLTLEGILDYLDHFNHSLFSSALQGCQKIGDFHQGTGVLLRLADLSQLCDLLASAKLIAHLPIEFPNNIC